MRPCAQLRSRCFSDDCHLSPQRYDPRYRGLRGSSSARARGSAIHGRCRYRRLYFAFNQFGRVRVRIGAVVFAFGWRLQRPTCIIPVRCRSEARHQKEPRGGRRDRSHRNSQGFGIATSGCRTPAILCRRCRSWTALRSPPVRSSRPGSDRVCSCVRMYHRWSYTLMGVPFC